MEPWKGYNLKEALSDLVSGLTVAFVRIPQGMAYAFLAGVQPQYGLYTGLDRFLIDQSTPTESMQKLKSGFLTLSSQEIEI